MLKLSLRELRAAAGKTQAEVGAALGSDQAEMSKLAPKPGHERMVPLAPALEPFLRDALRGKLPGARVVLNAHGRTPGRTHVLASLKALQRRMKLPERSFHALRQYFCSTLVRRGASLEAVRLLAGHGDLHTTQRYVHAVGAELTAAIAKLSGN